MKHIVVIDIDVDHLTLVQLVLSSNGYKVHSHAKWNVGLYQIERLKPDIIIIEVFLDTADGRNLASLVKQKEQTKHIPIILLSTDSKVKNHLADCGAEEFILKPINLVHFIKTIERLIAA